MQGVSGRHHSEETKRKISEAQKGAKGYWYEKHPSEETRKKISAASIGRQHSNETKKKLSALLTGKRRTPEMKKKISDAKKGSPAWNKGIPLTDETRKKLSASLKGRKVWNAGKKLSAEHRSKLSRAHQGKSLSREHRLKVGLKGERHHAWKGGITPIHDRIRRSGEYRFWRDFCRRRDNYTCQQCGKRGGNLHVDHIKPFALFPELRFDINNGRTLCVGCHRKTETYGMKPMYRSLS